MASTLAPRNPRSRKTRPAASTSAARVRARFSARVRRGAPVAGFTYRTVSDTLLYVNSAGQVADSAGASRQPSRIWKAAVIGLMAVGGLAMWIANPVLWLWITSRLQSGTQASMGPYALLLLGVILTCVAIGKGLSSLNRYYARIT